MRDYMDMRVTPPTWGPPPPCKQALRNPLRVSLVRPLKVIKGICDLLIHFDYYWTRIRIRQCETARMILFPFIDLSVFSVFITWARVPDQDDSKELSGSLSRNVFERSEVGVLNSWVVVFNKFQAQIFSLRVKTMGLASKHVKTKGFTCS